MESFHLFKPCGDHLVAHLYEHLVMQTLHRQLFEAGLFQAIDYQAYGIVYSDAGVMGIDVTLYTMQAERFVAQLRQPVAEYDDAMIDCALRQIIAEKGYPLTYHDRLALHEALHQLDTEPWYDAQDIDVLQCLGETAPRGIIAQREEWEADVMEYTIDISIDLEPGDPRAAVFIELTHAIQANTAALLQRTYGYYNHGYDRECTAGRHTERQYLLVTGREDYSAQVYNLYELMIRMIRAQGGWQRLLERLQVVDYREQSAPSIVNMIDDLRMVVGARGWRRIATAETVDDLLDRLTITVVAQ